MIKTSAFSEHRQVDIDPYSANPLEQDMANSPAYAPAKASGVPVPKMFQGGTADLPVFTASGIDPAQLMKLPFTMRHAMAAEPDPAVVHDTFEQYANQPDFTIPHQGLHDATARMSRWASTAGIDPKEDSLRAGEQQADAKRAADLRDLSPERRAAIARAAQQ